MYTSFHSNFKYSMKWECPPTNRNNLYSSGEATVTEKEEKEDGEADDEGVTV